MLFARVIAGSPTFPSSTTPSLCFYHLAVTTNHLIQRQQDCLVARPHNVRSQKGYRVATRACQGRSGLPAAANRYPARGGQQPNSTCSTMADVEPTCGVVGAVVPAARLAHWVTSRFPARLVPQTPAFVDRPGLPDGVMWHPMGVDDRVAVSQWHRRRLSTEHRDPGGRLHLHESLNAQVR